MNIYIYKPQFAGFVAGCSFTPPERLTGECTAAGWRKRILESVKRKKLLLNSASMLTFIGIDGCGREMLTFKGKRGAFAGRRTPEIPLFLSEHTCRSIHLYSTQQRNQPKNREGGAKKEFPGELRQHRKGKLCSIEIQYFKTQKYRRTNANLLLFSTR